MEWMEGHCCQCGNAIPTEEQRLSNGHLFCEFCSHPKFREPTVEILKEELPAPKTAPALPKDWPKVWTPQTFEINDPPESQVSQLKCTCDGIIQLPDRDWPGCCARCGGVIDRSEATLYDSQVRKSALHNGVTREKTSEGSVRTLLEALKSTGIK